MFVLNKLKNVFKLSQTVKKLITRKPLKHFIIK